MDAKPSKEQGPSCVTFLQARSRNLYNYEIGYDGRSNQQKTHSANIVLQGTVKRYILKFIAAGNSTAKRHLVIDKVYDEAVQEPHKLEFVDAHPKDDSEWRRKTPEEAKKVIKVSLDNKKSALNEATSDVREKLNLELAKLKSKFVRY